MAAVYLTVKELQLRHRHPAHPEKKGSILEPGPDHHRLWMTCSAFNQVKHFSIIPKKKFVTDMVAAMFVALPSLPSAKASCSLQVLGTEQSTAQVHPEKLTKALMAAAESQGATLQRGTVEAVNVCASPVPHVTGTPLALTFPRDCPVLGCC